MMFGAGWTSHQRNMDPEDPDHRLLPKGVYAGRTWMLVRYHVSINEVSGVRLAHRMEP